MSANRYLLIGPMPPPVNGQSNCFLLVAESFDNATIADRNVDQYTFVPKFRKYGTAFRVSVYSILFKRPKLIYISLSRSIPGLVFDSIIISAAFVLKIKVFGHLHGNNFLDRKWKQVIFGNIYGQLTAFIVLSPAMTQRMENRIHAPVKILINPVNQIFFKEFEKPNDGILRIVFFSHFMKSKGIVDFFRLASSLQELLDFEFHIIGDIRSDYIASKEEMELEFTKLLRQSKNVVYHGLLSGDKLVRSLSSMDIMIFPSYHFSEAFPLTILECAAQGMFIVANDHNDLHVFSELLPFVRICNTSDTPSLSSWLKKVDKVQIRKQGNANAKKVMDYSSSNHVLKLKNILFEA